MKTETNRRRTFKRKRQLGGDVSDGKWGPRSGESIKKETTSGFKRFSTAAEIGEWLDKKENFYQFIYGLGNFLKFKEGMIDDRLKNIGDEIVKLDEDFKLSIENYLSILGERDDDDKSMKGVLQEKLQEQLSEGYETKYNELVNKKQSYQMILRFLQNRRAYIVYELQKDEGTEIKKRIVDRAQEIYNLYRGKKYEKIRSEKIFDLLNVIAYTPSSLKNSFQLNTVITGPAGSGKTTMARELARWYSVIGILTYDSFYDNDAISFSETGRANFIGQYTGQTAPKTIGVLYQSLEKTLFMDEAYSIAGCNFDRQTGALEPDAYGEEFIAELLRFMNDHKGINAVIIAGYKNLMIKCFMERNEGLPRRFPNNIDLPLASTDELFNIFLKNVIDKSLDNIENVIKEKKKEIGSLNEKIKESKNDGEKATLEAKKKQLEAEKAEDETKKKEEKDEKVKFYTVMKPSFMMFHYDTTYYAIETLRKYLISIQYRIELTNDQVVNPSNIYSYTITTHVLMNLLNSEVRRNLMRRQFYKEVFQNEDVNLSFFKAQAGEMSLIADLCSKTIEPAIEPTDLVVSKEKEMDLLNTYFKGKNVRVDLYSAEEIKPPSAESTGTGGNGGSGTATGDKSPGPPSSGANSPSTTAAAAVTPAKAAGAAAKAREEAAKVAAAKVAALAAATANPAEAAAAGAAPAAATANPAEAAAAGAAPAAVADPAADPAAAATAPPAGATAAAAGGDAAGASARRNQHGGNGNNNKNPSKSAVQKKYYLEVLRADASLEDFQKLINSFLDLENLFDVLDTTNPLPSELPKETTGADSPQVRLAKEEAKELVPEIFQTEMIKRVIEQSKPTDDEITKLAALDAANAAEVAAAAGAAAAGAASPPSTKEGRERIRQAIHAVKKTSIKKAYESAVQYAQDIATFGIQAEEAKVPEAPVDWKKGKLPSLQTLYETLLDPLKSKRLIEHVLNLYLRKNSLKYVNDLLKRIETDFPVHLQRPELEGEQVVLAEKNAREKILKDMEASLESNKTGYASTSYANPRQRNVKLPSATGADSLENKTLKADLLWEDFGFY